MARDLVAPARVNEVTLVGRVSSVPTQRVLPSGDVLVSWRVVVERPPEAALENRRPVTVDTIDCVARRAVVRRIAARWAEGTVVELQGALRRRFWRGPHGPTSRYEVEVERARRLQRG